MAASGKAIEAKAAKQRQAEGGVNGAAIGGKTAGRGRKKIALRASCPKGKQDESKRASGAAAAAAGVDRRTLEKAEAVVARKRRGPTPSTALHASPGRTFKAIEAKAAKQRQQSGKSSDGKAGGRGKKKNLSESFAKVKQDNSKRTAAIVAAAAGISDRTLEKAEAVVAAAEAEPEKFRPVGAETETAKRLARHYTHRGATGINHRPRGQTRFVGHRREPIFD